MRGSRPVSMAALGVLLCASCTFEDGTGFAHLSGRLWSHFEGLQQGSGRLTSDGWFKTDNSYELELSSLKLSLRSIEIISQSSGSGEACSLDPAHPPAGCTLCHGGHCHCDGEHRSYEEIEADLCGGDGASEGGFTKASLVLPKKEQELLGSGTRVDGLPCQPSCELDAGQADLIEVVADRLQLEASLRDPSPADRLSGQTLTVKVDWDHTVAALVHHFPSPELFGRDHPYAFDLSIELPASDKLLDGVDWEKLARNGGTIAINDEDNHDTGEKLMANLAALTTLKVRVARDD